MVLIVFIICKFGYPNIADDGLVEPTGSVYKIKKKLQKCFS